MVLVIHRILFDTLRRREPFSSAIAAIGVVKFLIVSLGSLLIGLIFGVLASLLTLSTRHIEGSLTNRINGITGTDLIITFHFILSMHLNTFAFVSLLLQTTHLSPDIEPILLLVLAYTAYIGAEIFDWSGVISIIGCGLVGIEESLL